MDNYRQANKVALCPHCEAPFQYIELKAIGGINDHDLAAVECASCRNTFAVPVMNYELFRTQQHQKRVGRDKCIFHPQSTYASDL